MKAEKVPIPAPLQFTFSITELTQEEIGMLRGISSMGESVGKAVYGKVGVEYVNRATALLTRLCAAIDESGVLRAD